MKNTGKDRLLLQPSAFVSKCEMLTWSERLFLVSESTRPFIAGKKQSFLFFFSAFNMFRFCCSFLHPMNRPEAGGEEWRIVVVRRC